MRPRHLRLGRRPAGGHAHAMPFCSRAGVFMPKTKTSSPKRARKKPTQAKPKAPDRRGRALEAALAALAHDIRTPLGGILALSELLAASDLGERERQWALSIKSTAEHLASLTTLLIDAVKA